ncbi:MAG: hypothetical protein QXY49_04685 [Thermofilaceae archaeon]
MNAFYSGIEEKMVITSGQLLNDGKLDVGEVVGFSQLFPAVVPLQC